MKTFENGTVPWSVIQCRFYWRFRKVLVWVIGEKLLKIGALQYINVGNR